MQKKVEELESMLYVANVIYSYVGANAIFKEVFAPVKHENV